VALVARSSRLLRLFLARAGAAFETPLDPQLAAIDRRAAQAKREELAELARYSASVAAQGGGLGAGLGGGLGVSAEALELLRGAMGGAGLSAGAGAGGAAGGAGAGGAGRKRPTVGAGVGAGPGNDGDGDGDGEEGDGPGGFAREDEDEDGQANLLAEGDGEGEGVGWRKPGGGVRTVTFAGGGADSGAGAGPSAGSSAASAGAASSSSTRGEPESPGSLLLFQGARSCRLLAQLLAEAVMPGALSPTSLAAVIAGPAEAPAGSAASFVPPRPRLPLASVALIGAGENEGRLAGSALDVPQLLCPAPAFGLGGAPFRHACACALDVRMRQIADSSAGAGIFGAAANADPALAPLPAARPMRFDLEVRGPLLPLALPQLARVLAAMQAREAAAEAAAAGAASGGGSGGAASPPPETLPLLTLRSDSHLLTEALAGEGGDAAEANPLALPAAVARLLDAAAAGAGAGAMVTAGAASQPKRRRGAAAAAAAPAAGAAAEAWASTSALEAVLEGGAVTFTFR